MESPDNEPIESAISRRRVLLGTAAGGAAATAGCLGFFGGGGDEAPDPVTLDGSESCDNCNMVVGNHPGPVGEAFYLDNPPEGIPEDREDGIAHFCSTWCTYTFVLERDGNDPAVIYTTDYSNVDYNIDDSGPVAVISAHLGAESFADVGDVTYVANSEVEGAMGTSLIGFTDDSDAESFANDYGGTLVEDNEIDRQTLSAF